MNFDRIGAENLRDKSLRNPASAETDLPSSFGDLLGASLKVIHSEEIGGATARTQFGFVTESFNKMKEFDSGIMPDPYAFSNPAMAYDVTGTMLSNQWIAYYKSGPVTKKIKALQLKYPDQKFQTWDELKSQTIDPWFAANRQDLATKQEKTGKGIQLGTGLVAGLSELSDPMIAPFALIGPTVGTAKTLGQVPVIAGTALAKEAVYAGTLETARMPIITMQKQDINSPFGLKNAVERIVMVAGGAGIVRSGGSVAFDLVHLNKLSKKLRVEGKTAEADVLDSYSDLMADAPTVREKLGLSDQDKQILAYTKVQESLESGTIPKQADLDEITGTTGIEKIESEEIFVDAETFQFKKSDEEGVTDRLEGVQEWDPYQAGIVMVFEDAAGKRFIVDGHQRLALAKRLGKDQDGIELNAFVIREKDGFTPASAREIAARVNISQGTGTALDAAKVLRAASETGDGFIDTLPPNSALVRNARGLANLDDVSFRMVIDEMIDEKYGAIVGELISDAAEQAAVIRALAKAKPANANQARFMINDMKAAGFTKTETQDLFGGQEITESLFKERAKVIDSAMRQIKKDKSIFKTLAEQESRIAGAGNKLDRDANLLRLSDDEKTLAALTSLANAKGPVSDAINVAARRVKSGESIQRATRDILPELRRSTEPGADARLGDDGAGDADAALTIKEQIDALDKGAVPLKVIPPDMPGYSIGTIINDEGKIITVVNIDRSKIDVTCKDFCYPDLKPTVEKGSSVLRDTKKLHRLKNGNYKPARAKQHKKYIDSKLAEGTTAAKGDKPIVWLMGGGGASGKGTILKKLRKDGTIPEKGFVHADPDDFKTTTKEYKKLSKLGDYRAASVVHKESSDVVSDLVAAAIKAKKNLIIDKTLGKPEKALALINKLKTEGYDVRLVGVTVDPSEALVRALTRYFGSGRLVQASAILRAHKGFNANFDKYAKETDISILFDNTVKEPVKIAQANQGKIDVVSKEGYNLLQARGKLNEKATTHKQLRESQGLEPTLVRSDKQNDGRDAGRVAEGDQRSDSRGSAESTQARARLNDQLKDSGLDLDDPYLNELHATELKQVDDLLAKHGDMEIPTGARLDVDGNEVIEFRSAKQVIQELDDEQKVIDDMFKCMGE